MGGNPERSPMECKMCGEPATTRIPSGFACSECALDAFLEAADDGADWVPKLIDPPDHPSHRRPLERLRTEAAPHAVR